MADDVSRTTALPVPWPAAMDQAEYVAELRRTAEARKAEVRRLQGIIFATVEEIQRIEALAARLDGM